jgi:hypothetical protein
VTIAPIQEPTETPQHQNRSRNIFEDPAIQEAAKSDPFTRFVVQNWKTVLVTLLAVAGVMVSYDFFKTTALQKRANATARLADVQELYQSLVEAQDALGALQGDQSGATDEAKKKELTSSIEAKTKEIDVTKTKLSLMTDTLGEEEPFSTLARLYKGLIAGRFKDYNAVNEALGAVPAWASIKNKDSAERFVAETATLGLAKSLAQSDQHRKAAKEQLRALAENGSFLAVEAASALSVLLDTAEERTAFTQLIESVKSRFPSQEGYLNELRERAAF